MNYKKILKAALILMLPVSLTCHAQSVETLQQGKPTSIRGLSVVDDNTAWISGSHGYFAITTDGGTTWNWQQIKGFEKSDFRDVEAFSAKEAVVMSSGTPALILKTVDGGATWKECYHNTDTAYFLDAMDFENSKHGVVLGDPINGKFLLLETNDGGNNWHVFDHPLEAKKDEAAFAASGTCVRFIDGAITIASGGSQSRESSYQKSTQDWFSLPLPFAHQKPSQGAFSVAASNRGTIVVGGDYANDKRADSVACFLMGGGADFGFYLAKQGPAGFQSCVEPINDSDFLSTGTSGTNINTDRGRTWKQIDTASYNVCRKAKKGKLVLLAGDKGRIGILKM